MPEHDLARLRELREQYDRQTAAWEDLRARFAALPNDKVEVALARLGELLALASPPPPAARPARSAPGVRA